MEGSTPFLVCGGPLTTGCSAQETHNHSIQAEITIFTLYILLIVNTESAYSRAHIAKTIWEQGTKGAIRGLNDVCVER